jgi:hypothetical protein
MTRLLGAVLGALLLLTACDGGSAHGPADKVQAAEPATVRTADCETWNDFTSADKQRLVQGMREFFGGQVDSPGARGQVLPNGRASALFDAYCRPTYASAFMLYRIYGNAAAFTTPGI